MNSPTSRRNSVSANWPQWRRPEPGHLPRLRRCIASHYCGQRENQQVVLPLVSDILYIYGSGLTRDHPSQTPFSPNTLCATVAYTQWRAHNNIVVTTHEILFTSNSSNDLAAAVFCIEPRGVVIFPLWILSIPPRMKLCLPM